MKQDEHKTVNNSDQIDETELHEKVEETESPKLIADEKDAELIKHLTEQVEAAQDKLLRAMAESENIRHRMNRLVEETRDYSIFNFAKDLVSVIDNLSRAIAHAPENLDESHKAVIDGVRMTKNELDSVLKKHGLEVIEPKAGDKFDYNNHHAISQVETDEYVEGTIVSTMQTGYRIKDRLLRPAAVAVAKAHG